ncbi:thiamine biosynthesis lipoprotein [Mycoplana sp. BE70]|nr:thiamine biosynthesis lipoprotein [Mycoplana sp. BE70]
MSSDLIRHALSGATMGTRWSALVYTPPATDIESIRMALSRSVGRVDLQMSTWKPDSDLMRFNAAPPGTWLSLPAEFMQVLERALEIGVASGGAFDIGVGALVNAWGFGPDRSGPDAGLIRQSLRVRLPPTHAVLELDRSAGRARKHAPVALDLSGIAKGFAVDEMMRTVEAFDVAGALVSLDGEVKARGTRADGTPWLVAVEKPDFEARSPLGLIALRDAAVGTSGDYRHWVDVGGRRLSHTMDRTRGGPADNGTASVSVVTESCMDADAWATAFMVLGPAEGQALARKQSLDALFLQRRGEELILIPVGDVFRADQPRAAGLATMPAI